MFMDDHHVCVCVCFFFFFKQKTAYEMRISDWSSDVCSSDLQQQAQRDIARDRLERSVFSAPIDGLLVSVDVKPGETVIAGTVNIVGSDLMVLADPSVLLAELRVDEADIAQVQLGQSVNVFAAAYPHQALHGEEIGRAHV